MQGEINRVKALNTAMLAALQLVANYGPQMAIKWVSVSGVVHKAIAKAEGSRMIELPCKQGSVEWHEARLGIPTASEFRRIVTPRGNRSSSRVMPTGGSCLAEWALGEPVGGFTGTEDTERGQVLEPTPGSITPS